MLIGYARVSTLEQTLALQQDALTQAGCERLFTDTASGSLAARPGLTEALAFARPGDTLVVWRLDRLGRLVLSQPVVSRKTCCGDLPEGQQAHRDRREAGRQSSCGGRRGAVPPKCMLFTSSCCQFAALRGSQGLLICLTNRKPDYWT